MTSAEATGFADMNNVIRDFRFESFVKANQMKSSLIRDLLKSPVASTSMGKDCEGLEPATLTYLPAEDR